MCTGLHLHSTLIKAFFLSKISITLIEHWNKRKHSSNLQDRVLDIQYVTIKGSHSNIWQFKVSVVSIKNCPKGGISQRLNGGWSWVRKSHFYYIFKHLTHSLPCTIYWLMLIFLENVSSLNIPLCPAKYALLLYMMKVSQITLSFLQNPHRSKHFLYAPWSAYAVSLICTKIHLAKVAFFLMKMSSFRFQCAFLGWLSQMDLILLADCTLFFIFHAGIA